MTASPLTKVQAIVFEGMLLAPLDWLGLKNIEFSINTQCLLKRGMPIIIVHKKFRGQLWDTGLVYPFSQAAPEVLGWKLSWP